MEGIRMRMVHTMAATAIGLGLGFMMLHPLYGRGAAGPAESGQAKITHADGQAHYSVAGYDVTPLARDKVELLASKLDEETYRITQKAGTEPAFCGTLLDNKMQGMYTCVVCALPLFSSEHKFDSGSGWPSFFQPFDPAHVTEKSDNAFGMVRTEINCARCESHLGHVFPDGPEPSGMRHCLNSASLVFFENGTERPEASMPVATETAYFAGGCFWGVEHYFQMGDGVLHAESGYMNGAKKDPTYKEVCTGKTGHAEAVKVVFDPNRISYERLLEAFFVMHNPTHLNRQGPDYGTQYRSGVYFTSESQKAAAETYIGSIKGGYSDPVVTEVEAAETFYVAEDDHQDYILNTGRACHVTNPWAASESHAGG